MSPVMLKAVVMGVLIIKSTHGLVDGIGKSISTQYKKDPPLNTFK